jgi:hypothetical protein
MLEMPLAAGNTPDFNRPQKGPFIQFSTTGQMWDTRAFSECMARNELTDLMFQMLSSKRIRAASGA